MKNKIKKLVLTIIDGIIMTFMVVVAQVRMIVDAIIDLLKEIHLCIQLAEGSEP